MQRHQEKKDREKQIIKPKRTFARSKFNSFKTSNKSDQIYLNEINRSAFNEKDDIPELIYY